MEIRVQVGGLTGLAKLLYNGAANQLEAGVAVHDIDRIIASAIEKYGALDKLPYGEIIQSVVQFQGRRRRQR
jgi:hypothetical protein